MEVRGGRGVAGQGVVELHERGQAGARSVGLAHGDRAVEPDDGAVGEAEEFVVPLDDLDPVGLLGGGRVGVQGRDGGLGLVLAQAVAGEGRLEDHDALGDHAGVPPAPVLLGERHQAAVGGGPGGAPGVVEQHEGEQSPHLGVVDRGGELPGEPDGLGGEVDVAGVALVEDQVEDAQHGGDVAGPVEAHAGDGAFGAADALRHGRLGDQVGAGDLPGGEPAHGAQGEGDGGGRGERGVGAQEVELEGVVHGGRGAGRGFLLDAVLTAAARGVGAGRVEELAPRRGDQPALGVPRRVGGPDADRLDQRVLHGVLGRREVGSAADEDGEDTRGEAAQEGLVHRGRHSVMVGDTP